MREIDLKEYERSEPYMLSASERDALGSLDLSIGIEPARGEDGWYVLTPESKVGAAVVGGLSVLIRPKIGIPNLLSLACYASGLVRLRSEDFDFHSDDALPDVVARALARHARRAFARGLLHGYRAEEDALHTVRGRVRFEDQIRRRLGAPLPVEVRYDEFTDDVTANRLVKAAAARLRVMRLRSAEARRGLGWTLGTLDNVSLVEFPSGDVPAIRYDRLNEHYRNVVELSRLILRRSVFESRRGEERASGFLMDMNEVFQEFLTQALREALGVSARTLRSDENLSRRVTLDEAGRLSLKPDLSWWEGGVCRFVGDAKYKRVGGDGSAPAPDLYQMLAYTTALDLPRGLLIYAKGEADAAKHRIRHCGKLLEVAALDLSGTLDETLARVRVLANRVRNMRDEARGIRAAPV